MEILNSLSLEIDATNREPIYQQLSRVLERMIQTGFLLPGTPLPSDAQIAEALTVNPLTVRRAMGALAEKGLLIRKRRAGTRVCDDLPGGSLTVGFFYLREDEPRKLKVAEALQRLLLASGCDLKLVGFDRDFYDQGSLVERCRQMGLRAAVLVPLLTPACDVALRELDAAKFPYVQIGNDCKRRWLRSTTIRGDSPGAFLSGFEELWALGHREIGFIPNRVDEEGLAVCRQLIERSDGREAWLMPLEFSGTPAEWSTLPGPQIARGYLEMCPELTAILVDSAPLAVDLLDQAQASGRQVPQDLSIMGIADHQIYEGTRPRISSYWMPLERMAEVALESLRQRLNGTIPDSGTVIKIPHQLNRRDSVAAMNCLV